MEIRLGLFFRNHSRFVEYHGFGFDLYSGICDFGNKKGTIINIYIWERFKMFDNVADIA